MVNVPPRLATVLLTLVLGRDFDPVLAVHAHHQATLVVLGSGAKFRTGREAKVAGMPRQEAVPVVLLKAIVRGLPKVSLFVRENLQPRAKAVAGGLVEPVEGFGDGRLLEF